MKNYKLFPKFIIRVPFLPLSNLKKSFKDVKDIETAIGIIKEYFTNPLISQALYLASPELYKLFKKKITCNLDEFDNDLFYTFFKYLIRMSSRCTPFGLFASVNLGVWEADTKIIFKNKEEHYQYTRLDMQYLCSLITELEKKEEIRKKLKYIPNSTLYKFGKVIRYIEKQPISDGYEYKISEVKQSKYLNLILKATRINEGNTIDELIELLSQRDIDINEAREFVNDIIDSQLLISELTPNLTGDEYWNNLIDIFKRIIVDSSFNSEDVNLIKSLVDTNNFIKNISSSENRLTQYDYIEKQLNSVYTPQSKKHLFQVDLSKNTEDCKLTYKVAKDVRKALTALYRIGQFSTKDNLEKFKKTFYEKFESQEVPLLKALDNELGVGYAETEKETNNIAPIIDDILVTQGNDKYNTPINWSKVEEFYLKKYIDALKENAYEIEIKDSDLGNSNSNWEKTTDSFSVMIQVLDKGDSHEPLIYLKGGGYGSGANLIGRFTFLNKEIELFTKTITDHEKQVNSNAILASISHIPKPRHGNFLLRKKLYNYEIPILSKSDNDALNQISLQDLTVSIKENRIILWSKKLNKEIIPRLSTAHNYNNASIPVYHFLCDLQYQEKISPINFNWGRLKNHYTFLPRVKYQNVILYRAAWQFRKKDVEKFTSLQERDFLPIFNNWKKKWRIPNQVYLVESDNELFFDLGIPIFQRLFVKEVKNKNQFLITECLFVTGNCLVKDVNGNSYTNEILLFFGKQQSKSIKPFNKINLNDKVQRNFVIGTEWLYYKIYTSKKSNNEILIKVIRPVIKRLIDNQKINTWFFIRYEDSNPHIRLRINVSQIKYLQNIIHLIYNYLKSYQQSGIIWKIQIDTYQREIERYGSNTIGLFEKLFYSDSSCAIHILYTLEKQELDDHFLLLVTLKSIDVYLSDFGFSLEKKKEFVKRSKEGFEREFMVNKTTTKQLRDKYIKLINLIDSINCKKDKQWSSIQSIFVKRSNMQRKLIKQLVHLHMEKKLEINIEKGIWSLIHLSINRIVTSDPRKHELVFYNLLFRYYNRLYSTGELNFF